MEKWHTYWGDDKKGLKIGKKDGRCYVRINHYENNYSGFNFTPDGMRQFLADAAKIWGIHAIIENEDGTIAVPNKELE